MSFQVPIVPVIAKVDTMTVSETKRFRKDVVDALENNGVPVYNWFLPSEDDVRARMIRR